MTKQDELKDELDLEEVMRQESDGWNESVDYCISLGNLPRGEIYDGFTVNRSAKKRVCLSREEIMSCKCLSLEEITERIFSKFGYKRTPGSINGVGFYIEKDVFNALTKYWTIPLQSKDTKPESHELFGYPNVKDGAYG